MRLPWPECGAAHCLLNPCAIKIKKTVRMSMLTKKHNGNHLFLTIHRVFSGFYVGATVGLEGAHYSHKVYMQKPVTFSVDKNNFQETRFGSLFAGYIWQRKLYFRS
jgi:hypothetical protein